MIPDEIKALALQMTDLRLQEMLRPCGALRDVDDHPQIGERRVHYAFDSKSHAGRYYDMPRALQFRSICDLFALLLLVRMPDEIRRNINVVAGPERGAGRLVESIAHYLPVSEVKTVILQKVGSGEVLVPRHFQRDRDDRILLVDDIFRSGRTLEACRNALSHAPILAVGVAVNRAPTSWSAVRLAITVPIISAIKDPLIFYAKEECPWCNKVIEYVSV